MLPSFFYKQKNYLESFRREKNKEDSFLSYFFSSLPFPHFFLVTSFFFLHLMNTLLPSVPDDNTKISIKSYVLDPLSVIIKLAILSNKPVGTKLLIQQNVIYFQEPGPFQAICRMMYHSNKADLQYLFNPIHLACLQFLSKPFIDKNGRIKHLFVCAQNGVKKLIETYKSCTIITITLNYYYAILTNHVEQLYNSNMFVKDGFTCYYTESLTKSLNSQWTDKNIKVVLDLISFLVENNQASNNVKSLETIMNSMDQSTQSIIADAF